MFNSIGISGYQYHEIPMARIRLVVFTVVGNRIFINLQKWIFRQIVELLSTGQLSDSKLSMLCSVDARELNIVFSTMFFCLLADLDYNSEDNFGCQLMD